MRPSSSTVCLWGTCQHEWAVVADCRFEPLIIRWHCNEWGPEPKKKLRKVLLFLSGRKLCKFSVTPDVIHSFSSRPEGVRSLSEPRNCVGNLNNSGLSSSVKDFLLLAASGSIKAEVKAACPVFKGKRWWDIYLYVYILAENKIKVKTFLKPSYLEITASVTQFGLTVITSDFLLSSGEENSHSLYCSSTPLFIFFFAAILKAIMWWSARSHFFKA